MHTSMISNSGRLSMRLHALGAVLVVAMCSCGGAAGTNLRSPAQEMRHIRTALGCRPAMNDKPSTSIDPTLELRLRTRLGLKYKMRRQDHQSCHRQGGGSWMIDVWSPRANSDHTFAKARAIICLLGPGFGNEKASITTVRGEGWSVSQGLGHDEETVARLLGSRVEVIRCGS